MSSTEPNPQQDVENLAVSFENLSSPSPGLFPKHRVPVICVGEEDASDLDLSKFYVANIDDFLVEYEPVNPSYSSKASRKCDNVVERPPAQCVKCSYCEEDHPSYFYSYCPKKTCTICFKPQHGYGDCPFLRCIPEGEDFDRVNYVIVCTCGNLFNVDKWVCTNCTGRSPQLTEKYCIICKQYSQHCSYECPKDKVLAALYKSDRDRRLLFGSTYPYVEEEYEASTSQRVS